jgi:two-component system, OmpR family, KDP operon response regulator KdpE
VGLSKFESLKDVEATMQIDASSSRVAPAPHRPTVLVVEDEPQMRRFLVSTLFSHGFHSVQIETGVDVRTRTGGREPALVVMDIGYPGIDGVSLTGLMREWTSAPIVAVLNATPEDQRAAVLDAGANDYLVKPFGSADLLARVRVWLKQAARFNTPQRQAETRAMGVRLDAAWRSLVVDGQEVHLTPIECKLLETLARSGANAMSEARLLRAVWGAKATPPAQYLRARLRHLRQKIEKDPRRPRYLLSEPNGTYRLNLT